MSAREPVVVVGAGLAGCEAAWQVARRGVPVRLYEMKPERRSPAHESEEFAELVCSNSLRSAQPGHAAGLLKEEMRRLDSLVMEVADQTAVPAGRALAVDRESFSRRITERIEAHPDIEVRREVVERIPDSPWVVLATGPLTAPELARDVQKLLGEESLYFYDAISPIVHADSVDPEVAFRASRWEQGDGDYLNLPLDRACYERFVGALLMAETVPLHPFEADLYFEGCLPIEEMARRGLDTLRFGPMRPVGLADPRTGERPHAVVQLRQEETRGALLGLVGFQTKMRVGEQRRVLGSLPGMSKAVFARFGSVHRNTFVNAPKRLDARLQVRARPGLYIAGQMAGVEGYIESAALGWLAGVDVALAARGEGPPESPPETTAHGALLHHLAHADPGRFQPMNVSFGLFPPLPDRERRAPKRERHRRLAERALADLAPFAEKARARLC